MSFPNFSEYIIIGAASMVYLQLGDWQKSLMSKVKM